MCRFVKNICVIAVCAASVFASLAFSEQTALPRQDSLPQARLDVSLNSGTNWVSFSVLPEDTGISSVFSNYSAINGDVIISSNGENATYFEGLWYGALTHITAGRMYQIQCSEVQTFRVQGDYVDKDTPIRLRKGGNPLGYTQRKAMAVGDALANLKYATNSDAITDITGKNASYFNGVWDGTLKQLEPGKGYMLTVAVPQVFSYTDVLSARGMTIEDDPAGWIAPIGLQNTMLIYAGVTYEGSPIGMEDGSLLSAWDGDAIAGVGGTIYGPFGKLFSVNVSSNSAFKAGMTLKLYDAATDMVYDIAETFDFSANDTIGSIFEPQPYTALTPVIGQPDLQIVLTEAAPATIYAGDSSSITVAVQNLGNASASATVVDIFVSNSDAVDWTLLAAVKSFNVGELIASAAYSDTQAIAFPQTGTYYVRAKVRPVSGESAVANNWGLVQTVQVDAVPIPDLAITMTMSPDSAYAGSNVEIMANVFNFGQAASNATTVDVFVSSTAEPDWDTLTPAGSFAIAALEPIGFQTNSAFISMPTIGTYFIRVKVNPALGETNFDNNWGEVRTLQVTAAPAPDLRISSTNVNPESTTQGGSTNVTVTVQNAGTAAAADTTVDIFVTMDSGADWNTLTASKSFALESLAIGVSASDAVNIELPTAGTYYIRAKVNGVAGELSLINNWGVVKTVTAAVPTYTVTFTAAANGTITSGIAVQTVAHGGAAVAPVITANIGWIFTGWDIAFNNVTSNLTVTALYTQQTYTVTFLSGTNGAITGGSAVQTVAYGSAAVAPVITANTGWIFTGWDMAFNNVTSNLTVTALYTQQTYTVTFLPGTNGAITGGSEVQTVAHGSAAVAPVITANTGWIFTGWDMAFNNVTSNLTVTALYTQQTYTVTFLPGINGAITSGIAVQTVAYGSAAVAPVITANIGWIFTGWDMAFNNVTSNLTITALYTQQTFTVTFLPGENGLLDGQTVQTVIYASAASAPDVLPGHFWKFIGWDTAFDNVLSDLTVTAQYTEITCVNADLNANGTIDIGDLEILAFDWLAAGGLPAGDINGNDFVNMGDYAIVSSCWLYSYFAQQDISLVAGWNWISFNVLPETPTLTNVLSSYTPTDNDVVLSPNSGNSTYYQGVWYGNITEIMPGVKYRLKSAVAQVFTVEGAYVDESTPIQLVKGWNWLGYCLREALPIAEALANVELTDNDLIIASNGTNSTYYGGVWYGALQVLEPGKGYMLKVYTPQVFSYTGYIPQAEIVSAQGAGLDAEFDIYPIGTKDIIYVSDFPQVKGLLDN